MIFSLLLVLLSIYLWKQHKDAGNKWSVLLFNVCGVMNMYALIGYLYPLIMNNV